MKQVTIRAKGDDAVEILLYDVIGEDALFGGGVSAKAFRSQLKAVKSKRIDLRVNSPGGSVFDAAAMMAALDEHKAEITAHVDGVAASAASVVIMAADRIRVGWNALVMIHNPHALVMGGAEEMLRMAELLEKAKGQLLDAYSRRPNAAKREQLSAWMDDETWFTGAEAVEAGLADEVAGPVAVAALASAYALSAKLGWKRAPELPRDDLAWSETHRRRDIAAKLGGV